MFKNWLLANFFNLLNVFYFFKFYHFNINLLLNFTFIIYNKTRREK